MLENAADLPERLATLAARYDAEGSWPAESVLALGDAGCWRTIIPERWGGSAFSHVEQLRVYETIAHGCIATALLLTQRDGACDLIVHGENERLADRLLPEHAAGRRFTSIGISQLTTSKGGKGPKLSARPDGDGYVLDGLMPWVSGAERCDEIVTGAVVPDGRQIVACVRTDSPGVTVEPAMRLLALEHSRTSRVRCDGVRVTAEDVVRGPSEIALSMRSPVKSLVVSAVGVGHAGAIVAALRKRLDQTEQDVPGPVESLFERYRTLQTRFFEVAERVGEAEADEQKLELRLAVNDLLVRLATALLNVSKGSGFVRGHVAERLLREAMFFQVWSARPEVQLGTLERLVE